MVVVERAQGPNLNLIVPWRLKRGNVCVQFVPHAVGAKRFHDLLNEIGHRLALAMPLDDAQQP